MRFRSLVLGLALLFIVAMGGMTVSVIRRDGFDVLVALALVILALFLFGVVGALLHPPEE